MSQNSINSIDDYILLASETASSSSDVKFDNVFTSEFKHYKFMASNVESASNNVAGRLYLRSSVPADNNDRVRWGARRLQYDGTSVANSSNQTTITPAYIWFPGNMGTAANEAGCISVILYNAAVGSNRRYFTFEGSTRNHSANSHSYVGGGRINAGTAIAGVRFACATGNIESGEFKIYGIK